MQLMLGFGQNRQEGASSEAVIAYYTRMKLQQKGLCDKSVLILASFSLM